MSRYTWTQVCDSPQRYELFDSVTKRAAGIVEEFGVGWNWERTTNYFLQGVHPASGAAKTLLLAKIAVFHGLESGE